MDSGGSHRTGAPMGSATPQPMGSMGSMDQWPGWDRWPIEIDGLPGLPFLIAWWIFPWRTVNVISPDGEYMWISSIWWFSWFFFLVEDWKGIPVYPQILVENHDTTNLVNFHHHVQSSSWYWQFWYTFSDTHTSGIQKWGMGPNLRQF